VRLTRIDGLDLNLFEFDYDLTFVVFFMNADEKVYARYGQRDARGPDELQSLDGLRHTMNSVLAMHRGKDKVFAPRDRAASRTTRQLSGRGRRCYHCHNVKEALNAELRREGKWQRDLAWRYPLPDNLGLALEVDRGNVVRQVTAGSVAAQTGIARGDTVRLLGGVPIHSLADAQFALDRAPPRGKIDLAWERAGKEHKATLTLPAGWRTSDITWRPSMSPFVPRLPLYGSDLTETQKKALGLNGKQLAFRQRADLNSRARDAGIRAGDVLLGIDGKELRGMDASDFRAWVRRSYLVGDEVKLDVLRDGKRLSVPFTLARH
jgi:predicted metalloprotease with PDZ domain